MKSAEGSSCSFSKSWKHAPDPAGSQHGEDKHRDTDGGTSSSVGHVSFMDKQDAGCRMSSVKEEPEEEDYLCGEPSSSVGHIIHNTEFLKNPIKEEDLEFTEYLKDPIKEEDLEDTEYLKDPIKEDDSEDKDYFYGEDCKAFFINKCEVHGPAVFVPDTPVPLGVTDRARQTLPPGLEIRESSIPHAGLGVFNDEETIPVGAHFGPYQGELIDREEAMNSGYSWVIFKNRMYEEYIDGKSEVNANWMRYVNCARVDEEQNLVAFQYRGGILYRCCRPINPGQELLVWYEEEYAKDLSVVFDYLWNKKCSQNDVNNSLLDVFSCSLCQLSYTSQKSLHRHMRRCHNEQHVKLTEPITQINDQQASSGTLLTSTSEQLLQKELHNCLDCGKSFPHQNALQQHQFIHTGQKPYQCSQCGMGFNRETAFKGHQRIHTGEKPYHCLECGKSFTKKHCLQIHQRIHTGEKPYLCAHCGKCFAHQRYFIVHQRIHTGEKPHRCSQCGKSFTAKSNLRAHQLIHATVKRYHCSHCRKGFTEKSFLRTHERIHTGEKPYHCSECGKFYTYEGTFKRHQSTCKGEQRYFCPQCGESFTEKRDFQTHQRSHTEKKMYQCSHCGKDFTMLRLLQIHQRIHRQKPYQCSHCGQSFTEQCKLQSHQLTHMGKISYNCLQCGRSFTQKHNLQRHASFCTGENLYRCLQCGKSFTELHYLQAHQCIHTREKPFQCSHCGECLTYWGEVKLHQRVHQWRLAKAGHWNTDTDSPNM